MIYHVNIINRDLRSANDNPLSSVTKLRPRLELRDVDGSPSKQRKNMTTHRGESRYISPTKMVRQHFGRIGHLT